MHDDDDSSSSSSSSSHTISNPLSVKGQWPINTLDGKGKYRKLGSYQEVWKGSPTLLDSLWFPLLHHKVSSFILSWIEEEGGGGIYITLALDPKIRPCCSLYGIHSGISRTLSFLLTYLTYPPPPPAITHTHTHTHTHHPHLLILQNSQFLCFPFHIILWVIYFPIWKYTFKVN